MTRNFIGRLKDGSSVIFFGNSETGLTEVAELFQFPTVEREKEFQTDYSLDSDEWFFITLNANEKREMIDGYLSVASSSTDYNKVTPDQYDRLHALYLVRENDENVRDIIFNRIFDRYCIQSKTFFDFDVTGPKVSSKTNLVEFNSSVDAFWNDAENKLYFKKYST